MRYVLIPLTMFFWFLTAYYGVYLAVIGMSFMFSLSWIWLLLGYPIIIGAVFGIAVGIPSLLRLFILKLYGANWFVCITHSFSGALGIILIGHFFIANPPQLVIGSESYFILIGMWKTAPLKTIFLTPAFFGIILALPWSTVIAPVYLKLSGEFSDSKAGDSKRSI